ncbi:Cys/Met metabolism PLP-dependent enzyme-domain-containing protein [Armillaria luteobubalina]|uniref:Cys/Met metabolism PLP-dependent enzyme-domain-containing protein n=1 Tax=Armillaria luteobubalina TaxID=153913 RepID=A0AA39QBN1_9AGAR|nr:Cys/Met metabolism PLP-dependent enzyme-domain-containing protein [Armillaria luteobubalina]
MNKSITKSTFFSLPFTIMSPKLSGTVLIHGDEAVHTTGGTEVAPSISVSSTFKTGLPGEGPDEDDVDFKNPERHVYSRYTQDVSTRAEHILSKINDGHALTYASGLSAAYAVRRSFFSMPKRIAINGGYFGCHSTIEVYNKSRDTPLELIDLDDEFQPGDLCWLETPLNPSGESRDIKYYADKVHKAGGKILVDSTFAPPPLQYPFKWGADWYLTATKYFGGHSDLLGGVLVVKTLDDWTALHHNRTYMGNVIGSLDAWLLLRSLRTLHLRVPRQSETATVLAKWLQSAERTPAGQTFDGVPGGLVTKVWHSSLQTKDERGFNPKYQLEGGWNGTFAIQLATPEQAIQLPHNVENFVAATSLGGVESLIEYRARADIREDPRLIRISVGVEEIEDLKDGLRIGLQKVASIKSKV